MGHRGVRGLGRSPAAHGASCQTGRMQRPLGGKLGAWSLRLDALYCAFLGTGVALRAGPIATVIAIPQPLIAAAGITVVLWAGLLLWMLKLQMETTLRTVMAVNILAALLVAVCVAAAANILAVAAVIVIAVDIAIFAASQALALRTLPIERGL